MQLLERLFACVFVVVSLGVFSDAGAQKPAGVDPLEIIPNEQQDYYRFDNMRVGRETGVPVALYRVGYQATPAAPLDMAREYIGDNAALLGVQPSALEHTVTRETPGGVHVRFRQVVDGYPVYGTDIVVTIDRSNTVTFVMNSCKPGVATAVGSPSVSLQRAERIATDYLGVQGRIHYRDAGTVVYHNKGTTRLAHRVVVVPAEDKHGDWEVLVDALTGEVFRVENKAVHATGTGQVFDPDPLTRATAGYQAGGQFGDNNDADTDSLTAQVVQRALLDLDFDGQYHLRGPYAQIVDSESPFNGLFSRADSAWNFTRNADDFEAANVYFHLDQSMRYINETLGFNLMPYQYAGGVKGDPHGLGGGDNSHYITSTGELAWGEGGVDDAEDMDVILHELGHGLHDWLTNGGLSQVNGLSEGCGDYWAQSYNRSLGFWDPADPAYYWVFQWDGHNEFWAGRTTNYPNTYPDGLVGQIHTDGQIWASALMQIWEDIGRTATDLNFLEALSMTNSATNQEDAAQAFVQADLANFGGANLGPIEQRFTDRGYNITVPTPDIDHTPLVDTEDLVGPYVISADVTAAFELDVVQLIHGTGGAFTDTVPMALQSGDTYSASIPGTGVETDYNYYIFAADTSGLASTDPTGAPGNYHAFTAAPDSTPPAIVHTALGDQAYIQWPATVQATITDNIGVAGATVEYSINAGALTGSFPMTNTSGDLYSGTFDIDTTQVAIGDSVEYRIVATDASIAGNQAYEPGAGYHEFVLIDILGVILIIDDDPTTSSALKRSEKGDYERNLAQNPYGLSANTMATYLNDAGYSAVVQTPATTNPATWDSYDLLISSSGINESSLSNATYRNALVAHAQAGKKYLLEGGEVGWTWRNDATIMADLLHSSSWNGDNEGALNVIPFQTTHPIVTTPTPLPASIPITYTAYGSEDAMTPTTSYLIYDTTGEPGDAGISVYDDNASPITAQNVYFAFNFAQVTNQTTARALLENTVAYLLTPEPAPNTPPTVASAMPDTSVAVNSGPVDNYRDLRDVFDDAEDGDALAFSIESNSNPAVVTATIGADSALDLSFAPDTSGVATLIVRATDSGTLFAEDTLSVTVTALPETVMVTVTTDPPGLDVVVDSVAYAAPHQFEAGTGAMYEISAPSPQSVEDTVYVFSAWSDSGAVTHTVTVPGTSVVYTATFDTYYSFAQIDSIVDVPDDQGGFVNVHITRSYHDSADSTANQIVDYKVWRRDGVPAYRYDRGPALAGTFPPGSWALVDSFPATQMDNYAFPAATPSDSSDTALPYHSYFVSAHTASPSTWFASGVDSGYSVDNIAPAMPDSFATAYNTGSGNQLTWVEPDPDVREYRIYRSDNPAFEPDSVSAVDTTTAISWNDPEYDGWQVYYKVTAVDTAGNEGPYATDATPSAAGDPTTPARLALYQNAPNPFNPTTTIRFDVPAGGARVSLRVYDVGGRLVRTLVDAELASGGKQVRWNGIDSSGNEVASGIYFYRLSTAGQVITRKMVLIK